MTTLYNRYEDDFTNADESPEDIAVELFYEDYDESQLPVDVILYKGVARTPKFDEFFDIDYMLEEVTNQAYEQCGEWAEDYLYNVKPEAKEELTKLINDWVDKHNLQPSWFVVDDIEEFKYTVNKEDLL